VRTLDILFGIDLALFAANLVLFYLNWRLRQELNRLAHGGRQ
jgi:hypothetical protein